MLSKQILGGMLLFQSNDMSSTIQNFTAGYNAFAKKGLPAALGIQQHILNTPMGKCFAVSFLWSSSDLDEGRKNLDQIASFGTVLFNGVKETTVPEWMDDNATFLPKVVHGRSCTISLRKLTDEIISIIGREVAGMPEDPATFFSIHHLRGPSETARLKSVFGVREAHYCFEFIATAVDATRTEEVWDWAVGFRAALRKSDRQNILTSTYISLDPPAEANSAAIYGDNWEKLVEIKKEYDPKNVFKHALPKFPDLTATGEVATNGNAATHNEDVGINGNK